MNATRELAEADARRHPDAQFVDRIRAAFPTEREIDAVLSRKMRRRSTVSFKMPSLDDLVTATRALITNRLGYAVELEEARWLSGGASKLQVAFKLRWRGENGSGDASEATPMVMRMETAASVTESSRRREFEVLQLVEGIIPAPKTYWVDADAAFLPYPALIYGFSRGVAKPSHDAGKVSGLGQNYGPELRAKLAPQFIGLLAKLHELPASEFGKLPSFEIPQVGSNASIIKQVNAARRIWEEDRLEEEPVMEIVYAWLVRNAPPLDHVSVVHGDYRSGNFLFDEESGDITAWLDWEGAVLGDRHQDLTYATMPVFRHYAEDGRTIMMSGMASADDLFARYAEASSLGVDPARLRYFGIFNRYSITVLLLAASARAAQTSGTHQDVLLNHVSGMGYIALNDLLDVFRELAG